ncbi:MAG: asparagine synthase (glutamine-hydrolyzing) [Pseudomonadota bacterium]
MCGIVGVYQGNSGPKYSLADVRAMADAMVHRGPDDDGFLEHGPLVFGMRRLSIIDLDGGQQPIANADSTVFVINNGEIYNFERLREELRQRGHRFRTNSDTEVIVYAYEEFGDDFVNHLEGMFGCAIYDTRRRRLIIARDRMGIKPLYYRQDAAGVAFASEVKSLLALPGISAAIDTSALIDYLAIGYAVAPGTIFEGVQKLPPASMLIVDADGVSVRRYWSPPEDVEDGPSFEDWTDRVRDELERSVVDHLVADVPVGAFLSGGIDSSAVCYLMAKNSDAELLTYSIGYTGGATESYYNELSYARQVADQLGSTHREIEVQPDVASLLPKLIWHLEEPISDSAITTTFLVSEFAAQSVKVILSGVGGDELFAGYNRYLGGHYHAYLDRLPQWCSQGLLPRIAGLLPSGRQNRIMDMSRYAKRFLEASRLDPAERYAFYLATASRQTVASLLGAEHLNSDNGLLSIANREAEIEDDLQRLFRIDWQTQLAENLLLLTDKMTMAQSLECRVPFLDHRLVELAASVPAAHKLPGGRLKGLLKTALGDVLPAEIIDRRKRGFGAPVGAWFKRELLSLRQELLGPGALGGRDLLDPKGIERVCTLHDQSRADYTDLILVLMNLEIWFRLFVDGRTHVDVSAELRESSLAA